MEASSLFTPQIKQFAIKTTIVFVSFIAAVDILMPDFGALQYSIKKEAKNEKTRVLLLSFIQNPASLYRASEVDEHNGNIQSAVMEMEMAIGLLEMHNAGPQVISRYSNRLNNLKELLKNSATPQNKKD